MFGSRTVLASAFALHCLMAGSADAGTWGSFDSSRVASGSNDVLTTSGDLSGLRGKIAAAGDVLAPPTATLTTAYLSTVDVFFTSLLGGALSAAEESDLDQWVSGGGTLIVTDDAGTVSFTQPIHGMFGLSTAAVGTSGDAFALDQHALVSGVQDVPYNNLAEILYGAQFPVFLLGTPLEQTLAVCFEGGPAGSGQVLTVGSRLPWSNGAGGDASTFQDNAVAWVGNGSGSSCGVPAAFSNYGAGHAGTLGVPSLTLTAPPQIGSSFGLVIGNSSGASATTILLLGASAATTPTALDGTLHVQIATQITLVVPAGGMTINASLPNDTALCGAAVRAQILQVDAGASKGVSFSQGLLIELGD